MLKILIVDDHALVRMGIRRLLENLPDLTVVAEAENGEQALHLVKMHNPHVVLLDLKMPGVDGLEVVRRVRKTHPQVKIIAITAMSITLIPAQIIQLGAMGYLTKESNIEEIITAIRTVAKGEKFLSAKVAQEIAINSLDHSQKSPFDLLSIREMQVMLMITNGMSVQDIAGKLFLSSKTINGYRYRIFTKLGIKNDVELTFFAMKHGIIKQSE